MRVCNQLNKHWECKFIFNCGLPADKSPKFEDIGKCLQSGKDFVFPAHYTYSISDEKKLVTELKLAAMQAGFNLVRRTSKGKQELLKINSSFSKYVYLSCRKGVKYVPGKKKLDNVGEWYYTNTFLCHGECKCNFKLILGFKQSTNRWQLNSPTFGNKT